MTRSVAGGGAALWTALALAIAVSLMTTTPRASHLAHAGEVDTLVIPRARVAPVIDGVANDRAWTESAATTGYLRKKDGSLAIPVAEASFVYAENYLYVALNASDEDVRDGAHGDLFHLVFDNGRGIVTFDVSPDGSVRGGKGTHAVAEISGTKNDSRDVDHEWVAEVVIPLEALGIAGKPGDRIGFSVSRCDEPAGECAGFGDEGDAGPSGRLLLGE